MIILDTNVLSEVMKPTPSPRVLRWVGQYPALRLFTTAITQAEILYGLELLPKGKRRNDLQLAAEAMFMEEFAGRICRLTGMGCWSFLRSPARVALRVVR
jgi:predicted nucleic acid-binding protein